MKKKLIFYRTLDMFEAELRARKLRTLRLHHYFIENNKNSIIIHIFNLYKIDTYTYYHNLVNEYETNYKSKEV